MENFVVSARKYRPITFDSVVGQSHITTTLRNAIKTNQLAQAFLFTGPRGVGKTTCARILAKTINCQNVNEHIEPCNQCASCKNFDQNASFNIHELDAASNNSVEDIRNLIDQVRFPPQDGKYKVYIIDEVHMLSQAAFNAFLKTLEEPPSYAIFILATTEKHKILPTILSRCQIFDFNRIQNKDISDHLAAIAEKEEIVFEEEALELIAQKADGGLRDALSMFDLNVTFSTDRKLSYKNVLENLHVLDYDYYLKMLDALSEGNITDVLLILNEIIAKGFDTHQFIVGLNEHFRNILVCKNPATIDILEISENIKQKYLAQAQKVSTSFLLSALSVGSQIDINYKASKNQRLHVEIGLLKLSQINAVLNMGGLQDTEGQKKKVVEDSPVATSQVIPVNQTAQNQTIPTQSSSVPAENVVRKPMKSLRSVKALEEAVSTAKETTPGHEIQITDRKEFTFGMAKGVLMELARQRTSPNESRVLESDFELEGTLMTFKLPNTILKDIFYEIRSDVLELLKRKLHNGNIQIEAIITAEETKMKPRTEQEKFENMAEKNPNLWKLKESLDLDLMF